MPGKMREVPRHVAAVLVAEGVDHEPIPRRDIGIRRGVASGLGVRDAGEIERAVTAFARRAGPCRTRWSHREAPIVQRDLIITLAARHWLPAVYSLRFFVTSGGLISFGADTIERSGVRPRTLTASSRARNRPTQR